MSEGESLALLIGMLSSGTTILGFWISHRFESQRANEQRAHDLRQRRAESQQARLDDLQDALGGVKDGSATAAFLLTTTTFREPTDVLQHADSTLSAQWFQDWQAAHNMVSKLGTRTDNQELRSRVRAVGIRRDAVLKAMGNQDALHRALEELQVAYEQANDLAGQLYMELDAPDPVTPKHPWWQRLAEGR